MPRVTRYPAYDYSRTVCNLCPGGCGLDVRLVNDERSVKAEGTVSAPVNQGGLCPVGAAGPQYQYGISRFKSPLKRIGARASGAYVKASWSEAFQAVGSKLSELREQGLAHTVALISGRQESLTRQLSEQFMAAYGSPNMILTPELRGNRKMAETAQFGAGQSIGYDLENSKYVLSFGCGIIEGWGSPGPLHPGLQRLAFVRPDQAGPGGRPGHADGLQGRPMGGGRARV